MSAQRRRAGRRRRAGFRRPLALVAAGAVTGIALTGLAQLGLPGAELVALPSVGAALDRHLRLRTIEVIGLRTLEARALIADLGLADGTPLRGIDVAQVAADVAAHPRVLTCRALRIPPDRLLLDVLEREPVARLASGEGIDLEGQRFELGADEAARLPRVEGEPESALPLLRAAAALGLQIESAVARAPGDVRFRPANREVWVRVGTDPEPALRNWLQLADAGLLLPDNAREVDLRFSGSVVLRDFEEGPEGGTR